MAYSPATLPGKPGQLIIDENASISALRHESQHYADDKANGFIGMRQLYDPDLRWQMEYNAYMKEVNMMRQMREYETARKLIENARIEKLRIIRDIGSLSKEFLLIHLNIKVVKILPPDEKFSQLPTNQLIDNINDVSNIVRARIISVLGSRLSESPLVFEKIREAIIEPANIESRIMGLTTVSWFGVITVLENGDDFQKNSISDIMKKWNKQDKDDLLHYLKYFPQYTSYVS